MANFYPPGSETLSPVVETSTPVVNGDYSGSQISDFLIQTISDKTGFPLEMITSDMKLEEDLAVDSIRRVEILGAVQEQFPNAPTVGPEQLGVLQSIQDIVNYLDEGSSSDNSTCSYHSY